MNTQHQVKPALAEPQAKKRLTPTALVSKPVTLLAKIGGYLGRNDDPPPGHQLRWPG